MFNLLLTFSLFSLSSFVFAATNNTIVNIPEELQYILPDGYIGNTNYTFVNGTQTSSDKINALFASAKAAPFHSYHQEFSDIIGSNPEIKLIEEKPGYNFAYELGAWVPERNEVWFTPLVLLGNFPQVIYALNLETNTVSAVNTTPKAFNPNGGCYFEGKVYIGSYPNNKSYSGGVYSVDVNTLKLETVTNSYLGLRYNGIDDITWAVAKDGKKYMFFTDLNIAYGEYPNLPPLQVPANVYRYDPQNKTVLPVIGRNDINPNGVRISQDMSTLYVTDNTATFNTPGPYSPESGPADTFWLGPYIYAYDLDSNMMPYNRRVFGMARQGIADGIHVDDAGRVWTGEYEGIVVRTPQGKIIGVINSQYFQSDKSADKVNIANFALAGDILVVQATTRLWKIKLGQTVMSASSQGVD